MQTIVTLPFVLYLSRGFLTHKLHMRYDSFNVLVHGTFRLCHFCVTLVHFDGLGITLTGDYCRILVHYLHNS